LQPPHGFFRHFRGHHKLAHGRIRRHVQGAQGAAHDLRKHRSGRPAAVAGFANLGERFLTRLPPMPMTAAPYLVGFSPEAAAPLGLPRAER
jgi:hypothetical protein